MSENILTVYEFVSRLKAVLDKTPAFNHVALTGELSNFKAHRSGHFYFSLKDDKSRIDCVMFASNAKTVLFKPKDGDKVIIRGSCSVFVDAGKLQIYADKMNLDGLGDLYIRFEELKKRYFEQGYFAVDHKLKLPGYPETIAVVTGKDSAAFRDIERTLAERWPLAKVLYFFAAVQGTDAHLDIIKALQEALPYKPDVLILARGGGSIEDLWAFNEPALIDYLYHYPIPLVSGVGHESDTSLVDLVADYRAATPTAAVVSATPSKEQVYQIIRTYKNTYYKELVSKLRNYDTQLHTIQNSRTFKNPELLIDFKIQKLDYITQRILNKKDYLTVLGHQLDIRKMNLAIALKAQLSGYNDLLDNTKKRINQAIFDKLKDKMQTLLFLQMKQSGQEYLLKDKIKQKQEWVQRYVNGSQSNVIRSLTLKKQAAIAIIKELELLSPLHTLARGYALAYEGSRVIHSIDDINENAQIEVVVHDGVLHAQVYRKVRNNESES